MANRIISVTYNQTLRTFSCPCVRKEVDNKKEMSKKFEKIARFVKKG